MEPLTIEQIELLRKMPYEVEPTDGIGNEIVLETKGLTHRHFRTFHMTPAGEVLLATLDHHTTKAKEDERRRNWGAFAELRDILTEFIEAAGGE